MNKRLIISIGFGLSVVLAVGLVLVSASAENALRLPFIPHSKKPVVPVKNRKQTGGAAAQAPAHLAGQSATLLPDGRWLLAGGESKDGPLSTAIIADTRTNATSTLPNPMLHSRAGHSATMLPNGTILIFGGVGTSGEVVSEAEIFHPESQRFEPIPLAGLTPRAYHTATLLTDGRILIAGGVLNKGRTTAKAEIWDAGSGTASALKPVPLILRQRHTATLLSNGSVLLSGGVNNAGVSIGGVIFDPETHRFSPANDLPEPEEALAPSLSASLPKDGETAVAKEVRIALRFSKSLRVETVNSQTVALAAGGGAIDVRLTPAESGRLAFITPVEPLLPGTTYTLSLSGSTDLADVLLVPTSLTFTTTGTHEHEHEPTPEQTATVNSQPSESVWTPDAKGMKGDWRSGGADAAARSIPPLKADAGVTALAGHVLTLTGRPLANVTLEIGDQRAVTDQTGRFLLTSLTAGQPSLLIRGETASRPGTTFGTFETLVDIAAGKTNVLPYTIWLPVLDDQHGVKLQAPTTREVAVTTPLVPGMEVRVPSNVVLRMPPGHGMTMMKGNASHLMDSLAITPIPLDRTPFPLPPGSREGLLFTLQMHGAKVEGLNGEKRPGIRIIYPNILGLPAGTRVALYNYESTHAGWYLYGQGTVTPDGRQVVPDPGAELNTMYCTVYMGGPAAPGDYPRACGECADGDPVDLATGLFVYQKTDLFLPDVMPVALTRTYRQNDGVERAFGKGAMHPYNLYLIGDSINYGDVILPDGGRIRFNKVPNTNYFEHTATPSRFYKATLKSANAPHPEYTAGWDVKLLDGTTLHFYRRSWGDNFGTHASVTGLHSVEDRHGNKLTIERDDLLRPTKITSPHGRRIEFTYDGSSERIIRAQDNLGRVVTYEYYPGGELRKVTDPNNGVTEYTYDWASRMLTIKDARGIVFLTNEYDANGRVKKQTQADQTTFQFAYTLDTGNRVIQTDVTDPRGNIRRATFNSNGYWLTDTYAVGKPEQQTYTYERDAVSNKVLTAINPLGHKTVYTYYPTGSIKDVTNIAETAAAAKTSFTYDSRFEQVKTVTDPLTHTTTFGYDDKGNLLTVDDPLNHRTTLAYNQAGQLSTVTDHLQHVVEFVYDSGDLVEVVDPLGHHIKRYVDGGGRVTRLTNAVGQGVRYEYDSLNQVKKVIDPILGETSFTYDENGNLKSVTDARGKITSYSYDVMDRVETRTDPLLKVERYAYDEAGNLKKFTDRRNKVTTFRYDNLDRISFAGFGTIGEGEAATYESTVGYSYDALNRLTQALDSVAGTITRSYDDVARTASETTVQGVIGYGYDAAGRQTSMAVAGQPVVSYGYDDASRLTTITQGASVVGFGYDEVNRRISLNLPNSVAVIYGYDDASQLTSLTYKRGATVLGDLSYEYDAAGRRVKMGGSYARTALPQALTSSTHNDGNQLTQRGTATLTYDDNGNLTSDGVNTYTWNARNQLQSMSGAVSATFQYDAFGRRVSKTINSSTTGYLYDGVDAVQEIAGGSAVANMLVGSVDEVFSRTEGGSTSTLLQDGIGSTLALLDSAGGVQTNYTYEPFGKTTPGGAASGNKSQYTARENDGTGLYYYRNRFYSPTMQRFISEDPTGFAGGINLYAYVENSPLNFSDPFGLDLWGLTGGGTAGAAVGGAGIMGTGSYMIGFNDHNTGGRKVSLGGAGSFGFSGGDTYSYPDQSEERNPTRGGGLGATLGAGGGVFWSNAKSFADLKGTFETTIISTPWGVGVEIDKSGPTYIVSITGGKGLGAGIFHFKTNTPEWTIWETDCEMVPDNGSGGAQGAIAP
jgi:RHS repeat-associated protein